MAEVRLTDEERTSIEAALASNLDSSVFPPIRLSRIEREYLLRRLAAGKVDTSATLVGDLTPDDATPAAGQLVTFTLTETIDDPLAYEFRAGDGSESQRTAPPWTHTYATAGSHGASVVVSLVDEQRSVIRTCDIIVADTVPVLSVMTAAPATGPIPLTVTHEVTNTGGEVDDWLFDPDDGSGLQQHSPPPWRHTYVDAGTFTPIAHATNQAGSDTAIGSLEVSEPAPQISVQCAPAFGYDPLFATISAQVQNGVPVTEWTMDPGDGGAAQGPGTPRQWAHTYGPGVHVITVTAEGPTGTDVETTQVQVVE